MGETESKGAEYPVWSESVEVPRAAAKALSRRQPANGRHHSYHMSLKECAPSSAASAAASVVDLQMNING